MPLPWAGLPRSARSVAVLGPLLVGPRYRCWAALAPLAHVRRLLVRIARRRAGRASCCATRGRETGVGQAEPSGPRNRMVFPNSSKIGSVYSIKVFS